MDVSKFEQLKNQVESLDTKGLVELLSQALNYPDFNPRMIEVLKRLLLKKLIAEFANVHAE